MPLSHPLNPRVPRAVFLAAVATAAGLVHTAMAAPQVDYGRQIKPVLQARCFACHGVLKQEAGLRLDSGHFIRKGSRIGKIVIPGRAEESRLVLRVLAANPAQRMPPEGEALKPEEVAALKEWIAQGAVTPAGEAAEADPRRHWSFLPVTRPAVPQLAANPRFPIRNPIDAFVSAEAGKRRLTLAPPASQEILLRRVFIDLVGVPPTRAELQAFRADRSPGAYEKVVDRLLASPAYGERWGRHWMDVWRYSDWYGRRKESDVRNSYGQMWRWRDWIVRSLNADKPYDQMVVEMLAADEADPENDEAITATGFLVRNWYSLNYNQWMRDNVEHTGKAFLGLTLNCAHCHDHKYDPISQQEYFKFRAFFEPLELRHDRWPGDPDPGPFKKYIYGGSTAALKSGMIRVFDEKPDAKTFLYRKGDERERFPGEPTVEPGAPAIAGGHRLKIAPVALPGAAYYPGLKEFIQQEETVRARAALTAAQSAKPVVASQVAAAQADLDSVLARIAADNARFGRTQGDTTTLSGAASKAERLARLRTAEHQLFVTEQALAAARAKAAADSAAPAQAALKQAEAKVTEVSTAVNQARQGAAVESAQYTPLSPEYSKQSSGRRLALAKWIASPENPLTARVAVNHIWMRHFGRPLVETVFDFGRNGKAPTHPALLDWLAHYFMAGTSGQGPGARGSSLRAEPRTANPEPSSSAWRMKALHRLIVTSSTYRMSSTAPAVVAAANARIDSENRYLWRYNSRRVEAEVLRDSILSAAGTLDNTLGGPELDNTQENTRRRSLYYSVYAEDGGSMRFLTAFDAPNTCDAYRRTESVVPQQALAIVNSRLTLDQGRLLARALWKDLPPAGDRDAAFITAAFEQILTRSPSSAELKTCREYLQQQTALFRASGPPPATPAGIIAPSVDPNVRAAESLAQALFSHNDFLTIR